MHQVCTPSGSSGEWVESIAVPGITEWREKFKWIRSKHLSSMLAAARHTISDDEFNMYVLVGLSSDYDSIVTSLRTQPVLPSPNQMLSHLLVHEARLAHQVSQQHPHIEVHHTTAEANFIARGRGGSNFRGRNNFRNRGRGPPRGGGRTFTGAPDNRLVCQLCNKPGHTALRCWHRFDQVFQAAPPAQFQPPAPSQFQANATSRNSWFPDTAATHHFTPDIANLRLDNYPYEGTDIVSLGDGSQIPIHNFSTGSIASPQRILKRSNLLHTPLITKNLLSVQTLCRDNHVFFEFHSDFFLVKDLQTSKVLLRGPVNAELYELPVTPSPPAARPQLHSTVAIHPPWHSRLGHPSNKVAVVVLNFLKSSTKNNGLLGPTPCRSCSWAKAHSLPHPTSPSKSPKPLHLLFMDVWGPAHHTSLKENIYYISIVDD